MLCQSIGTSGFETKLAQTYMNDKTFEKINIKLVISVNLENFRFSQFRFSHQILVILGNFSFQDQICLKKTLGWSIRTKAT